MSIFDRSLLFIFGLVLALLLGDTYLAYRNIQQLNQDKEWVLHTQKVIGTLDDILSLVTDAETSQRGFIITGDDIYMGPYNAAVPVLRSKVQSLEELVEDNPLQKSNVTNLKVYVSSRMRILDGVLDIRRTKDFKTAQQALSQGLGRQEMSKLRQQIREMKSLELELLEKRTKRSKSAYKVALWSSILSGVFGLLALIAFVFILRRHLTLKERASAMIYQQKEQFRTTLASIGDAVLTTDNQGRITYLNPIAETLTGWRNEEAIGHPVAKVFYIINEQTRDIVENPIDKVLKDGRIVGLANHTILVRKDGYELPIDDSAAPILDPGGNILGVVLVFRDVTERRRTERELRDLSFKLAQSNKELEHFAYIASHDLQEPVQMINSFADLLERRADDKLDKKEKEYLNFIKQGSLQAKTLIKELLEYSLIGMSRTYEPVNLEKVLKEVEANLKFTIKEAHAQIESEPLPVIQGKHLEMVQLFQNLISNAIKYRGKKSPKVRISCVKLEDSWQFSVEDNGIGIEPKYKEHIFGMFQRLHTKSEYSGTGIGLATCKKIVEHHGGKIWVESEPGEGSTFYFTLKYS